MATCTPENVTKLKSCCGPECHSAVDQLAAGGLDFATILGLFVTYGPALAQMVEQILAAFKPKAQGATALCGCLDDCDEEFKKQHDLLCEAMCLNLCLAKKSKCA